jgi:hypothetical protein
MSQEVIDMKTRKISRAAKIRKQGKLTGQHRPDKINFVYNRNLEANSES